MRKSFKQKTKAVSKSKKVPELQLGTMENKQVKHSRRASFFKVLNGDFSKHLTLPSSFAKNFNGKIPHWLFIEIAGTGTRKCWRVDVVDDGNGGLQLTDGWSCFVEAQTVEVGNLLVFAYKGECVLEVTIYNKDGSEKLSAVGQVSDQFEEESYGVENSEIRRNETSKTQYTEEAGLGKHLARQPQERSTRKRTKVSVTEKGVSFTLAWRETSTSRYYQAIPTAVVLEKNLSSKTGVMLKDQHGRSWLIQLTAGLDGGVYFSRGWGEFVTANQLSVGDTLTFEFSSDHQVSVHVTRTSQVDHPPQSPKPYRAEPTEYLNTMSEHAEPATNSSGAKKAPESWKRTEKVCRCKFTRSSFSVTWKGNTRAAFLHVPAKVAKEQNLQSKKTVLLCDEQGTQSHLKVKTRLDGRVTLTEGWPEFRKGNNIVPGDTLKFEFVSDCVMKVNITRA